MPNPKRGPNIWVIRHGDAYSIKTEGARAVLVRPMPQHTAAKIARLIARAYHSELIVQGVGGRIVARDSHGFDPRRSRG